MRSVPVRASASKSFPLQEMPQTWRLCSRRPWIPDRPATAKRCKWGTQPAFSHGFPMHVGVPCQHASSDNGGKECGSLTTASQVMVGSATFLRLFPPPRTSRLAETRRQGDRDGLSRSIHRTACQNHTKRKASVGMDEVSLFCSSLQMLGNSVQAVSTIASPSQFRVVVLSQQLRYQAGRLSKRKPTEVSRATKSPPCILQTSEATPNAWMHMH